MLGIFHESAEGSVCAGVRISHDDDITRLNEPLLGEKCVADTILADVKKILDLVAPGPFP